MSDYEELLKQREDLDAKIGEIRVQEVEKGCAQIHEIMKRLDIKPADLGFTVGKSSEKTLSKVTPKYKNPESGDTWSGRGMKPTWLKDKIGTGHNLEEFLIQQA